MSEELPKNEIIQGDCREVLKDFPNNSIDLVVTDPPFEIHSKSGGGLMDKREWLDKVTDEELNEFNPNPFLDLIDEKLKDFNAYIFTSKDLLKDYINWINKKDYNWDLLVLKKTNPIPTKNNKYLPDTELCIFIRESGAYFNSNREYDYYRKVKEVSVTKNEFHPTQKDVEPLKEFISISSKKGDVVLDPFFGSGSIGLASKELDRDFLGIEIKPKYVKIAKERLKSNHKKLDSFVKDEVE